MRIRKISQIVFVLKKKTPHEYDSGTNCNQVWDAKINLNDVVFLTDIITKDDIIRYLDKIPGLWINENKPISVYIYCKLRLGWQIYCKF